MPQNPLIALIVPATTGVEHAVKVIKLIPPTKPLGVKVGPVIAPAYVPSFSTLTLSSGFMLVIHVLAEYFTAISVSIELITLWAIVVIVQFLYPLFGLALDKAPLKAYVVILTGPVFIFWRTWLALSARYGLKQVTWIRTTHVGQPKKDDMPKK